MDWRKVIRAAGRATQPHAVELEELQRVINTRLKKLAVLKHTERIEAAWAELKTWTRGDDVWCNASGVFLGGNIQRGTHLTFWSVQPRKKIAWFKFDDGGFHWFNPAGLLRYNLQRTPPANPVSPELAKRMEKVGEVLNTTAKSLGVQ